MATISFNEEKERTAQEVCAREAKRDRENAEHKAQTDKRAAELRALYPWAAGPEKFKTSAARAAYNIRMELAQAFPRIQFSVTSKTYSMGNSVDARWAFGPTTEQVGAILAKYQSGSFDGMQDLYEYDSSAEADAVGIVLGHAKYVHSKREFPDAIREQIARALCDMQRIPYQDMNQRGLYGDGDDRDLQQYVYQILNRTDFGEHTDIVGLEANGGDDSARFPFKVIFPVAAVPAASALADVQKHFHTKRGFNFWLVVPFARMERGAFDAAREECERLGGWYSRQWGKCPGGFAFTSEADARAFAIDFRS